MAEQEKTNEEGAGIIFAIGALVVGIALYYNAHYFADFWRWIRFGELYLLQWIPPFDMPFYGPVDFNKAIYYLSSLSEFGLTFRRITQFDNIYGLFIGVPAGIVLIIWSFKLANRDPNITKSHDIESLFAYYASIYPYLKEIYDAKPQKKSLHYNRDIPETYRWGKPVNPLKFATFSPPLLLEEEAKKNASFNKSITEGDLFDEDLAERAFAAQLGDYWKGPEELRPHELTTFKYLRDLLPVDNARVEGFVSRIWLRLVKEIFKTKDIKPPFFSDYSEEENNLVAAFWSANEKEFQKMAKETSDKNRRAIRGQLESEGKVLSLCSDKSNQFKKHYQAIRASVVMSKHAYVRTGLMQLNDEACKGGRVSVEPIKSEVKSSSRELWYALKSSGRKTSHPEGSGCFAHWLMEIDAGQAVTSPCVQNAVVALKNDLKLEEQ